MPTPLKDDKSSWTVRAVYKRVRPDYKAAFQMDCYANEKHWLERLQPTGIVPTLLCTDDQQQTLVTEYVGTPVTRETLPHDWETQRDRLLLALRGANCRHNDIKPREILVQDGVLRLVDFGWASCLDQPIPDHYPECLGCKWRCPDGLDDVYSFNQSIHSVLSGN